MVVLWALAGPAGAQNVQKFDPAVASTNYVTVEGAATAPHLTFVPSVWLNWGLNPLVLRNADREIETYVVEHLFTLNALGVVGLGDHFELGVDVPAHSLSGDGTADRDPNGVALGDLRLLPKVQLFGPKARKATGLGLALAMPVVLPTGDKEKFVGSEQVSLNPRVIAEARVAVLNVAANVGYRFRPSNDVYQQLEVGNELTYGAAAALALSDPDYQLIAELAGAGSVEDVRADSENSPMEAIFAFRAYSDLGAVFTLGAGRGLIPDYGAPAVRVFAGLAWQPEENDRDGDGILDPVDACPDEPEDKDGFQDADGCPDPDNDKDGILDVDDRCPNEPETRNGVEDTDGCPDEAVSRVRITKERIEILDKVYFETAKAVIKPVSYAILNEVALVLVRNPNIRRVRVEGHTDSQGKDAYNLELSQRRVDSVRAYLMNQGVAPERLDAKGYGETQPIADNGTADGRAENRRVEFRIMETVEQ
jgi:outer membrane protein OmpA-like peptidoglycan-associated protein